MKAFTPRGITGNRQALTYYQFPDLDGGIPGGTEIRRTPEVDGGKLLYRLPDMDGG